MLALVGPDGWASELAGRALDDRYDRVIRPCHSVHEVVTAIAETLGAP